MDFIFYHNENIKLGQRETEIICFMHVEKKKKSK